MTNYLNQIPTADSILLVEDDSNDVILIRRAFRKAGIEIPIHIVADGEEAITYLTNQPPYDHPEKYPLPTLVLLDLKLPRVSGLEVLEWLRNQPKFKRLLVVVLTSSQESPDVNKAYDLGANSYLIKPVNFDDLTGLMGTIHSYWLDLNQRPLMTKSA
jgi:CheY-like chemotaxis protein